MSHESRGQVSKQFASLAFPLLRIRTVPNSAITKEALTVLPFLVPQLQLLIVFAFSSRNHLLLVLLLLLGRPGLDGNCTISRLAKTCLSQWTGKLTHGLGPTLVHTLLARLRHVLHYSSKQTPWSALDPCTVSLHSLRAFVKAPWAVRFSSDKEYHILVALRERTTASQVGC
jgi:hypothetical protein